MNIKEKVKKRCLGLLELLPFGSDMYLRMARNRIGISYRGIFESYAKALAAVPSTRVSSYDIVNQDKAAHTERTKKSLDNCFNDYDYPLLFWLSKLFKKPVIVLELGGSIGHCFYTFQNFISYPHGLKWIIAELYEAYMLGCEIAKERNEDRVIFIESNKISTVQPVDIFVTSGTLQYMEERVYEIIKTLKSLPKHVIIHNLPSHRKKQIWTLQKLRLCEVPYQIYSSEELIREMKELGYDLIAKWKNPREVNIPFHLNLKVEGYLGFYFCHRSLE